MRKTEEEWRWMKTSEKEKWSLRSAAGSFFSAGIHRTIFLWLHHTQRGKNKGAGLWLPTTFINIQCSQLWPRKNRLCYRFFVVYLFDNGFFPSLNEQTRAEGWGPVDCFFAWGLVRLDCWAVTCFWMVLVFVFFPLSSCKYNWKPEPPWNLKI